MNIIEESYKQMNTYISTFFEGVVSYVSKTFDGFNTDNIIMTAVFVCMKIGNCVNKTCMYLYNNIEIIRIITTNLVYATDYVAAFIQYRNIEPIETNWISVSILNKQYYTYICYKYYFSQVYEFTKICNANIPFVKDTEVSESDYKEYFDSLSSNISREIKHTNGLVIMKSDDNYVHRVCNKNSLDYKNNISYELSEMKFLSIVYSSKNYGSIFLELKRGEYLVNNELFSSTFVKRLLEHQVSMSEFDINYEIKIMDNNLKNIVLKSNQYIILSKTDYEIVSHDI